MRKLMKLALEEEQIRIKEQYNRFDGYEIHLYGKHHKHGIDHFELVNMIQKPIITVHYPIEDCDVYDVVNSFESEYAHKIFDLCKAKNAGLVIHAETGLDRLKTNPKLDAFCEYMKEERIVLHVENCYRHVGAVEGLKVCNYLRDKIGWDQVFPLLDTCHLIMSEMSFKFEEMSFFSTIDAYTSENFKIHLNDCIGSGEKETGGIHGTNFYANQYLLWNVLWKLKEITERGTDIDLVLEVDEVDYNYPTNADILAKNINIMWEELKVAQEEILYKNRLEQQ
ncbi:MAG: TIM barrel protein [Solobacterium sp.]|nr:TIM barrel protein [Solobacterium sp.]